jgi:hypothetical protein
MRAKFLVGNDDYMSGWDEYQTREDAEAAALGLAQDEEQGAYIYRVVAEVKADYRVVPVEEDT